MRVNACERQGVVPWWIGAGVEMCGFDIGGVRKSSCVAGVSRWAVSGLAGPSYIVRDAIDWGSEKASRPHLELQPPPPPSHTQTASAPLTGTARCTVSRLDNHSDRPETRCADADRLHTSRASPSSGSTRPASKTSSLRPEMPLVSAPLMLSRLRGPLWR
jgi:hypothetical protein